MQLTDLELQKLTGLSEQEVAERLKRDGYNELPSAKKRGVFKIIAEVIKEPMFVLLVACGSIYLVLGDKAEAVMLLGFVFVIMGITIYQERKTERAIEALREMSSPRALVIREGRQLRIPGREVVIGDIIIVREGDRIPADARLLWGMNLTADESLLTGESVPVRKSSDSDSGAKDRRPGGDDQPFLYSGSIVVQGQGVARVIAIGASTEMGKIGKVLARIEEEDTILQKETGRLVKFVFAIAAVLCLFIILVYGLTHGQWLKGVLSGITLAMAMLPEEFPVVLTIFLAMGAWRISKKEVLTRRIAAVETLGAATVLCVDKTGTLTKNQMRVKKIFNGTKFYDIAQDRHAALPEVFHELIEYGILASKKDPFDPIEKALEELGHKALHNTEHIHTDWPLVEEYPFSQEIKALSHVWKTTESDEFIISTKGAPEAIADLCHFSEKEKERLISNIYIMASEGLRVLGVAKASFNKQKLPQSQHDFNFKFIGLIGLADPIRETVPVAIKVCYDAGIRVVMITGDYPVTAQNIAKQIGLKNHQDIITGEELAAMNPQELKDKIERIDVFTRVVPEQKLLIIDALKANNEVVAMTGDGVNDAPALKSAHIGIAMGERGTDVARESAALVLLKDDFSSIVDAVRMGRKIFDNLKKAMAYIISIHVPIAGISLIPVILGWPIVLYPVHIVFLELIIDPVCSVVFESEKEEADIMKRLPRKQNAPLFGKRLLFLSFLQGVFSLACVIAVFKIALIIGQSAAGARTLAFITLVISNICLVLTNRSWAKSIIASMASLNKALVLALAGIIGLLFLVIYLPMLQKLFHFEFMHPQDLLITLTAGVLSVLWFELVKVLCRRTRIELL